MNIEKLIEWLGVWTSLDDTINEEREVKDEIIKRLKEYDSLKSYGTVLDEKGRFFGKLYIKADGGLNDT